MGAVEALDMNYDARKYTVCCPWYGQRSSLFRLWQQAFRAGVADELDDDSSLDETADGTDLGGDQSVAVLAAMGAGNPLPVLNAAESARRRKRLRKLYKLLHKHVENEEIRTRLRRGLNPSKQHSE